jgi:hypothetical protein
MEDGMASVRRRVDRLGVTDWDEVLDILSWLQRGEHSYRTVVLDSLNQAQTLAMNKVLEAFPGMKRSYESLPNEADYGKMLFDFQQVMGEFKGLPIHVIFIAQTTNKVYDTDLVGPQLIGKATAKNICRMMDVVGYIYKTNQDGKTREMAFDAVDFVTKDRSDKLPPILPSPTYEAMAKYWL